MRLHSGFDKKRRKRGESSVWVTEDALVPKKLGGAKDPLKSRVRLPRRPQQRRWHGRGWLRVRDTHRPPAGAAGHGGASQGYTLRLYGVRGGGGREGSEDRRQR